MPSFHLLLKVEDINAGLTKSRLEIAEKMGKMEFEIGFNSIVYGFHGVEDFEKENGNQFKVALSVKIPLTPEIEKDDIKDTVSYVDLHDIVITEMQKPRNLLEKVAFDIVNKIKGRFPQILSGKLTIEKVQPPIPGILGNAFVTLNF